ncbi:phage tail protein [Clostridioides sp. ES-S-0145-01]|uniref:phage tail protein n=1 Tax=unclassified Clostridioides TaxID=2635829 RepID=UPI001D0FB834|nr:phage tail protein [Clostridioides sp. ES-S-0145-01]UDN56751.1 phage tail protein [Clostridioides sp. ES-S-0010-02]
MSWAEVFKINSDIQGEPLNYLNYLQDLKLNALDSYILHNGNIRIWEELYLNSLYLFSDKGIRETVYTAFSETDIDNLFNKSTKLGEQLNAFYRTDIFSPGNADNVVKGMTIEYYNSLEQKFKDGYDRYVTREQEKTSIGTWFNSTFNLNNTVLESLTTIDEILANTEATNAILNNSNAIVALTMCKSSMDAVVATSNAMDLLGQYILRVTVEPAVIKAIIKNPVIRDAIINSSEAMTQIATNENSVMEIFSDLEATKTLLKNQSSMDEVLKNDEIAKEIIPRVLAMKTVASNNATYKINIDSALNLLDTQISTLNYNDETFPIMKDEKEIANSIRTTNNILGEESKIKTNIADAIMNSSIAMNSIAKSSIAMNSIASRPLVINALLSNTTCINALANNSASVNAIAKQSTIITTIANSSMAMSNFANSTTAMSIFKSNSTIMNIFANNSTAMSYIVSSSIAMSLIAGDYTAMYQIGTSTLASNRVANSSTAMSYIASNTTAMSRVASSGILLKEICNSNNASVAIAEKIQAYRVAVISTISNTNLFTRTAGVTVGSGASTIDDGLNTKTIYIPTGCYDDGDTNFTVYYGCKNSYIIVPTITSHKGTVAINTGISLRGVRVVGTGSSVGNVIFDKYEAT